MEPTPPVAGSTIVYTAIGASDANGVGSTSICPPFATETTCPNGMGYVAVTVRQLKAQGFTLSHLSLGIPTAVIGPDGLIGRVVDVRPGASIVQVLTDPTSTVGAHAVRTRTQGIVEGEPRGTLRFKYMARDGSGIQVGDLVVTSGAGGVFPRGIPVGRVRAIDDRGSALFHYAQLVPAVDFARIDEVLLIVGDGTHDLAALFAPPMP